ncbi:MAG TPA: histidinol-phosphate transaminase [Candidatus Angelobacter sp.]|jgi:histidinol-phosphate aminotransferase|nr:histidinol-phosphate transaminase [Candidatus Angelobacter sp.]
MKKTVLDQIPEHIRALAGYVPGKPLRQAQQESGGAMIKLASNENPFGPSPLALEAIRAAAAEVNLYPDNDASELRQALAARHQLNEQQIFIADGSLGILDVIARTLLVPGTNCISSERSFISYPIVTRTIGAQFVGVPMRNDAYDLDAIAEAINEQTRAVILANPNNPTGTMFDADATETFLNRVPGSVLVVLDEAYSDFAEYFARQRGIAYSRSFEYVRAGRQNVLVLRTFSKAHGLAGIRLGYACGNPELLRYFARVRNSFSISVVAEAAGLAAIRDENHIRKTVENNAVGAAWLMERFKELGIRAVPTSANFIYFTIDEDANAFAKRMQAEGVIVRSLAPWGAPNAIRVSIGTPDENETFVRALKKLVRQTVTP